jgi:starch phosphorylase
MSSEDNSADITTGQELLRQLAMDLRWSWNHATDELWRGLEPELWSKTHNPWVVLQTVSPQRLALMLAEPDFRARIERLANDVREETRASAWYQQGYPSSTLNRIAYFSMEFMLSEVLPIYAGGLGNVAGDQLKAASDLGVPVVGVGLLYQQGYFRQVIDHDGNQQALFPYNDPGQLPVTPLRKPDGEWLRLELKLPGYSLWLRAWQVTVGRAKLYLLDSNDIANYPAYREITGALYGGNPELRLQQEIVLGIGGWRLLETLGLAPDVCHLNEGHAAFAVLDRARAFMLASGQSFETAMAVTRAGNVFTTHTAVPAGFDRFAPELIGKYFSRYAGDELHISLHDLLALGRQNPGDDGEPFNMAYLAMRGSASINGVSRLHGEVSRRIFLPLFPRWPVDEVPVGHVTNGIHAPSWDSAAADELWTGACGKNRWRGSLETVAQGIRGVADARIWQCRSAARAALVEYARERLAGQLTASGVVPGEIDAARHLFSPDVLTLGFARRFATYKRPNLLLHDPERLVRLLTNPQQPVQLILAGKAHPADAAGQALIGEWVRFVRRHDVRPHAIFLADYDMQLTEQLVQGVDVWINTPRRPWEASGTSGMKVLVNGGLNLSELDGWWAEAYAPDVGWALGDGREHGEDAAWDAAEAARLFDLLERDIIPQFYHRDGQGIPRSWVARVRESMARLTPAYSANRSVREYVEQCYLPAGAAYQRRAQRNGALGAEIVAWRAAIEYNWPGVRFGRVTVETLAGGHQFTVEVILGALRPQSVRVELYAEPSGNAAAVRQRMQRSDGRLGASGGDVYTASVAVARPAGDYTARIVPDFPTVNVPLEAPYILWQR